MVKPNPSGEMAFPELVSPRFPAHGIRPVMLVSQAAGASTAKSIIKISI
jgi:hypothetical protein